MKVGVFALQGDFQKHMDMLNKLGAEAVPVKTASLLNECDGLIIPGGESTTFLNLIDKIGLRNDLISFIKEKPVMTTCAGSIIVASNVEGENRYNPLGVIDLSVLRNAYGRQVDSFVDFIDLTPEFAGKKDPFEGVFIRAPRFVKIGKDGKILGTYKGEPVLVEFDNVIAATFHPELTNDNRIHSYFLTKIK